jgi:hypothetical protein
VGEIALWTGVGAYGLASILLGLFTLIDAHNWRHYVAALLTAVFWPCIYVVLLIEHLADYSGRSR